MSLDALCSNAQLSSDRDVLRIVRLSWHPTRDLQKRGATRGEKKKGIKIKNSRLKHKREKWDGKYAQGREEKKGRRSAL